MTDGILEGWGRERGMNDLEAAMWRAERPPANAMCGSVIEVLDRVPDWNRVWEAHEWMIGLVPRLRERVVDPPLPTALPVWAEDPGFDLAYHLRRVHLPTPGTRRQLMDFAQAVAVTPFDRSRPLWVGWLIEGLEHDRAAYVLVVHHCLFDGAGIIQLLTQLHSRTRRRRGDRSVTVRPAFPSPAAHELWQAALRPVVPEVTSLARQAIKAVWRSPSSHLGAARRLVGSVQRAIAPPGGEPTELLSATDRRTWRYAVLECELPALKAAAKATGATLNDVYVAGLLGGVAEYHARRGEHIRAIPMTLPVSVRRPGDPAGGNRFVAASIGGPAGTRDPAERVRAVQREVRAARAELTDGVDVMSAVLPLIARGPSGVLATAFNTMQNRADLTASNVPGIPDAVYMAGALVERAYFFGPLPGAAIMAVLLSHGQICTVALTLAGDVITEPEEFAGCIQRSLDEVIALGRDRTAAR